VHSEHVLAHSFDLLKKFDFSLLIYGEVQTIRVSNMSFSVLQSLTFRLWKKKIYRSTYIWIWSDYCKYDSETVRSNREDLKRLYLSANSSTIRDTSRSQIMCKIRLLCTELQQYFWEALSVQIVTQSQKRYNFLLFVSRYVDNSL